MSRRHENIASNLTGQDSPTQFFNPALNANPAISTSRSMGTEWALFCTNFLYTKKIISHWFIKLLHMLTQHSHNHSFAPSSIWENGPMLFYWKKIFTPSPTSNSNTNRSWCPNLGADGNHDKCMNDVIEITANAWLIFELIFVYFLFVWRSFDEFIVLSFTRSSIHLFKFSTSRFTLIYP